MSINLETVLALLLLPIVGSIPSAAGQNALSNITASDIIDLVDNVTEGEEEVESPLPSEAIEDTSSSSLPVNASDIIDLVDNVTEGEEEVESPPPPPPPSEAIEDTSSSSPFAGDIILINEVELNPRGNDIEKEWIELYNPTAADINISDFEIRPLFKSPTIKLPPDAIIEAGETYVIELDRPMLSNTGESIVLANATGDIQDRTPSLVDRSDDESTWQRIPDGNDEWQFVENTQGNLNDPDTLSTILDSVYSESDVECLGSAGCLEGMATRIVDGDTLYVSVNGTVYKVDLALTKAPSRIDEMFVESTAFTRDLCLGSTVLVDQDDMLLTSNSDIIAVVYCSSSNLNSELLDNGYVELETEQCTTSEFANESWAKDHGC